MKPSERPDYYKHKYDNFEVFDVTYLLVLLRDVEKGRFEEDKEFINAIHKEISWREKERKEKLK